MSSVVVRVVAANGVPARLIEWFGGEGFSHFACLVNDQEVIDARADKVGGKPPGVAVRPLSYLDAMPAWLDIELECSYAQRQRWIADLYGQCGKPYDKIGILDFALGRVHQRDWKDDSSWFCSELGIWALEQAGVIPALTVPAQRITPGTAALICEAAGGKVVREKGL